MGLFSSSYETSVSTAVSRLIEDKKLPNAVKSGLTAGIFSEDGQIVENILEYLTGSLGIRAERMYEYGGKTYAYGLPTGKLYSPADVEDVVTGLMSTRVGKPVEADYVKVGNFNLLHSAWVKLQDTYGYNAVTNELASLKTVYGTTVFLKDLVVIVKDITAAERADGSLELLGVAANAGPTYSRPARSFLYGNYYRLSQSPVQVNSGIAADFVRMTVEYRTDAVRTAVIDLPTPAYVPEADYVHIGYSYDEVTGTRQNNDGETSTYVITPAKRGYWTYQIGSGTVPEIDALYSETYLDLGSFYPFAYYRFNKAPSDGNTASVGYKTSKKLAKLISLDYDDMVDGINTNPDVGDVEQAMMVMAVPATTVDPLERRYLFDFFKRTYFAAGGIGLDVSTNAESIRLRRGVLRSKKSANASFLIQDRRFKMALSFNSIHLDTKAGVIGAKGTYTSGRSSWTTTKQVYVQGLGDNPGELRTINVSIPFHFYRKQITETVYEEVAVYNLSMVYYVYGGYNTVSDGTSPSLLVPIDRSITENYSIPDKELLYARSMHFVFNSRVVTKVKWYQQGIFQDLLKLAAIAIAIYSMGTSTAFSAAMIAGTYAVIQYVVIQVLISIVISAIAKQFVKIVGAELAFLIAIALAFKGGFDALKAGSLAGAPFAKELLMLSSNLTSGINAVLKDSFTDLQKEMSAFLDVAKEQTELLKKTNDLLDGENNFLSPFVIFGEKPNDFYQRCVHSGNIGIAGIDAVSNFCAVALTLPTLTETIEGEPNGIYS